MTLWDRKYRVDLLTRRSGIESIELTC